MKINGKDMPINNLCKGCEWLLKPNKEKEFGVECTGFLATAKQLQCGSFKERETKQRVRIKQYHNSPDNIWYEVQDGSGVCIFTSRYGDGCLKFCDENNLEIDEG